MKKYDEWRINEEGYAYNSSVDGPPLEPHTIHGAENQIRTLARNIRTTFGLDPKWQQYKQQILKATQQLDEAANILGEEMSGDERNDPHQYH